MEYPKHLAIIMDGNGRWAQNRGHHRVFGHARGAKVAKTIIEDCAKKNLSHLTLFTFSTENWRRPNSEVSFLMRLLARHLKSETPLLVRNNIQFNCIGDSSRLPALVRACVEEAIAQTASCTGMKLTFALSYGGRQEIVNAAQTLAQKALRGEIPLEQISESLFESQLDSFGMPDPDLIIRTSGEHRLSNFFLWQAAYSEFYVCEKCWPDFTTTDLDLALEVFASRERRFGRTGAQVIESSIPLPTVEAATSL